MIYELMVCGVGYIYFLEHNIVINGIWSVVLIIYDSSVLEVELVREDCIGSGLIVWVIFVDMCEVLFFVVGNFFNMDVRQASFESVLVHKCLEVVFDQFLFDFVVLVYVLWDFYFYFLFLFFFNEVYCFEFGGVVENMSYEVELVGRLFDFVIELDVTQFVWLFEGYFIW